VAGASVEEEELPLRKKLRRGLQFQGLLEFPETLR
jgi:hypothetical protein